MKSTIRPAEPKDFEAILSLARTIAEADDVFPWEGFDQSGCEADQKEQTAVLAETWLPDAGQCREAFVCQLEDLAGIAGVYVLQPNGLGRCRHVAQGAYMVDPAFRGRGLGKQLCKHSLQEARKLNYTGMQFDMVVATNVAAIKAWTACGFKIMCSLPRVFHHPKEGLVDAHVMFNDFGNAEAAEATKGGLNPSAVVENTFSYAATSSTYSVGEEVDLLPQPLALEDPTAPPELVTDNLRDHFKVDPPLPEGLSLCPRTGAIQGAPTKSCPETTYRVTACTTSMVTFKVCSIEPKPSVEASICLAINEDFAAHVENIVDVAEMPKEPTRTRAFGDWMIWMVHRAWLNDPTLVEFNFDGKHMPAPHLESRIAPKLMKAMQSNAYIEVLSMSNSNVQKSTALELAEALRQNCTIRTLNLESNCLDSNCIRELALSIKDNTGSRIEHLRLQHQRQMGAVFGRPTEEAIGQLMQRNETIVKLGFGCDDAHWRNLIDRALVRNNDFSRRRSQVTVMDVEVDHSPHGEKTLGQLVLQETPRTTPSDFFSDDNRCRELLRAYMVQNLQLPTTSQLQQYGKNGGEPIQYTAAAPLIKECRSWLLDKALSLEVSVVDAFGRSSAGTLRAWQQKSLELDSEAGERLTFKADKEPAVFLGAEWASWLKRTTPAVSHAGA